MDLKEFEEALKRARINKADLAKMLGVAPQSVYNWGRGRQKVPYWVSSWLDNYIKAKDADHYQSLLLDILKEMGDDILDKYVGDNLTRNHLLQKIIMDSEDNDPRLLQLLQKLKELKKGKPHKKDQESSSLNGLTISRDELRKAVIIALDQLFDSRVEQLKEELLKRLKKEIEKDKKSD